MSHVIVIDTFGASVRLPRQAAFDMYYKDLSDVNTDDGTREQCASVLYGINQGYAVVNESWNY